jgi:hypothetical protein
MENMLQFLLGLSHAKIQLRFTHDETLLPLITFLGLIPKDDLNPNDTLENLNSRSWKTFQFGGFAANIGIELYQCHEEQVEIRIRVNENYVEIPDCGMSCELNQFIQKTSEYFQCDFDTLCQSQGTLGGWNQYGTQSTCHYGKQELFFINSNC